MKLFAALLLVSGMGFSQNLIVLKDKSSVIPYSLKIDDRKDQIIYQYNSQERKLDFKDLDSAKIGDKVLKPFQNGKKTNVYYVLATYKGKNLAVVSKDIPKYAGGYESVAKHYEIVLTENGRIIETLKFTNNKSKSGREKRESFFSIAAQNFAGCVKFLDKIAMFKSDTDPENLVILNYLDNPIYTDCN